MVKNLRRFGINHDIGYNIVKISQIMKRELLQQLRKHGITPEQLSILRILSTKDRITQFEIGKETQQDPPTITRTLERMKRNGYIKKNPYNKDRRAKEIIITKKGRELQKQLPYKLNAHFNELLKQFSKKKKKFLKKLLLEFYSVLHDSIDNKKRQ